MALRRIFHRERYCGRNRRAKSQAGEKAQPQQNVDVRREGRRDGQYAEKYVAKDDDLLWDRLRIRSRARKYDSDSVMGSSPQQLGLELPTPPRRRRQMKPSCVPWAKPHSISPSAPPWHTINAARHTPDVVLEAVVAAVMERGLEALEEPKNLDRVDRLDENR